VPGRRIRAAVSADVPAIAQLHLDSYRAAYRDLLPAPLLADLRIDDRHRRWQASMREPARATYVVEDETAAGIIAVAEIGPCRDADATDHTGELIALHVAEPFWRQGVGSLAHRHALGELAAHEYTGATLWVLTGNARARRFYEAAGWTADGTARDVQVLGTEIPEVRYRIGLRRR
jgi:RimJ/RimL family protein N-acetyltransferase